MSDSAAIQSREHQRHHGVDVFINTTAFEAPKSEMTGRELLELGGLPETNQLFLEVPGPGDDRPIGLDEEVKLHEGMKFYDVPVGTFG